MSANDIIIDSKDLQKIFELHKETDSFDSVNWAEYSKFPYQSSDGDFNPSVTLKNRQSVAKYLFEEQGCRKGQQNCDVFISTDGGNILCHSHVLSFSSPVLKQIIKENVKEIGKPSGMNPVHITLENYKFEAMAKALQIIYTGFSCSDLDMLYDVRSILDFFQIKNLKNAIPTEDEMRKNRPLEPIRTEKGKSNQSFGKKSEREQQKRQRSRSPSNYREETSTNVPDQIESNNSGVGGSRKLQEVAGSSFNTKEATSSKQFKVDPAGLKPKVHSPRIQRDGNEAAGGSSTSNSNSTPNNGFSVISGFQKVVPGSLAPKIPEPRIKRKSNKKSPQK